MTDRLGAQGTVLGGGRYDGLIEALGGPHTPAVGWAAGIERLAMLVGARDEAAADVVIAVEDDAALADALRALAALRRAGLSGEIVATGSPRKRYDKATKIPAKVIAGLSLADGALRWRLRGDDAVQAALRAVLPEPGSA